MATIESGSIGQTLVSLKIPSHGALIILKTLEIISTKYPTQRSVQFVLDSDNGLYVTCKLVTTHFEKGSFSVFDFKEDSLDSELDSGLELDDLDRICLEPDSTVYSMNQEIHRMIKQFRAVTGKDSLQVEVLQSHDSKAPDLMRFVINANREFINPSSLVEMDDLDFMDRYHVNDVLLLKSVPPQEFINIYNVFRDNRVKFISFDRTTNPNTGREAIVWKTKTDSSVSHNDKIYIEVSEECARKRDYTDTMLTTSSAAESREDYVFPFKDLTLFKLIGAITSSINVSLNSDPQRKRLVIDATLPKNSAQKIAPSSTSTPAVKGDETGEPPKKKKKSRSSVATVSPVARMMIRLDLTA